jgi:transposase-like protein
MGYEKLKPAEFFEKVKTEADARAWLWRARCGGKDWECPNCTHPNFYEYKTRPDIRECKLCMRRFRVRAGTLFEHSKLPILIWLRALFFVTQDKRGVSALQLFRFLGLGSYRTAWRMLHKIRRAFSQRDESYKLSGLIELDGASFAHQASEAPKKKGQATVLVAVETKEWVDDKGRPKQKAGFAKVKVTGSESKIFAQRFVNDAIAPGSQVNTDAGGAFIKLKGVDLDYQKVLGNKETLDRWLPWVHRFISNAKTWILGTHHGVKAKYLQNYLAEFAYRFNRRHDLDGLFHRALTACALARPIRLPALCG